MMIMENKKIDRRRFLRKSAGVAAGAVGFAYICSSACCPASTAAEASPEKHVLKALVVTGQSNRYHNWAVGSRILKGILEKSALFRVEMAVSPGQGSDMSGFKPDFSAYDVLIVDYEGDSWPEQTRRAFVNYVRGGGGVVVVHATDNAFGKWKEFNEIIGLGAWGGRDERSGPLVRWREGKIVLDNSPGKAGTHPPSHNFQVINRNTEHPITKGLPEKWMHISDELYSRLRGPAKNLTVLSTGYCDPKRKNGTGEHEPVLFTVNYGKGRTFHTVFGHVGPKDKAPIPCMDCVGFIVTLQRGAEWAATGKVTQEVPPDFPTAERTRIRKGYSEGTKG